MIAEVKILGIALAVGLDVLALSIAVGVMRIGWPSRLRLALAFPTAEVFMQALGYAIGSAVGHFAGAIAAYAGFLVLFVVGVFIFRESFERGTPNFRADSGWGLVATSASVSLDSLGVGVSLPAVPLSLIPLLATVAVSTVLFTLAGLAFGEQLGQRYKAVAQRVAGLALVVLAIVFTVQHIAGVKA